LNNINPSILFYVALELMVVFTLIYPCTWWWSFHFFTRVSEPIISFFLFSFCF